MSTDTSTSPLGEVRFGPLPSRSILLGLSGPALALTGLAVAVMVVAEYLAGAAGVAKCSPLWGLLLAVGLLRVGGRAGWEWLPLLASWAARRVTGRTNVVGRPGPVPVGQVVALPGLPGALGLVAVDGSRGVGCWDRREQTVTIAVPVTGAGVLLAPAATTAARVGDWGRALGGLCRQPAVVRVQVLAHTVPAPGALALRWWTRQLHTTRSGWPAEVVTELLSDPTGPGSMQVEQLLAITLRAPGRTVTTTTVEVIERQITGLREALTAAGVRAGAVLDRAGWVRVLRTGYDPYAAARQFPPPLDDPITADPNDDFPSTRAGTAGEKGGVVGVVGPVGVREAWDHVVTDTACHAVYWIAEWPRSPVTPLFLQPLLCLTPDAPVGPAAGGVARTFSLTATPLAVRRALREIRRAQVEAAADAGQRARIGQVEDEATRAQARDLARREADLAAGHGELAFTALLAVTAPSPEALRAGCVQAEADAAQAMCELRLLVGQQGAALTAAAVPLARDPS